MIHFHIGKSINAQLKNRTGRYYSYYLSEILNKALNFFNFELYKETSENDYVHITNYNILS